MKMKKLAVSMLSAGLVMSLGVGTMGASANDADINETSEAKIHFKQGEFKIKTVSSIEFDEATVDSKEKDYFSKSKDPSISLIDNRGSKEGWTLTAELGDFFYKDDIDKGDISNPTLPSSELIFPKATASSISFGEGNGITLPDSITLISGGAKKKIAWADSVENIQNANGMGESEITWISTEVDDSKVKLNVPDRSASPGEHVATINWQLTNGPQ